MLLSEFNCVCRFIANAPSSNYNISFMFSYLLYCCCHALHVTVGGAFSVSSPGSFIKCMRTFTHTTYSFTNIYRKITIHAGQCMFCAQINYPEVSSLYAISLLLGCFMLISLIRGNFRLFVRTMTWLLDGRSIAYTPYTSYLPSKYNAHNWKYLCFFATTVFIVCLHFFRFGRY